MVVEVDLSRQMNKPVQGHKKRRLAWWYYRRHLTEPGHFWASTFATHGMMHMASSMTMEAQGPRCKQGRTA